MAGNLKNNILKCFIFETDKLLNYFKMRKLVIVLFILTIGLTGAIAQKGKVASASNYLTNGQLEKAWEAIQEAEKNEKTAIYPKTFFVKGQILQQIGESKDENIKKLAEEPLKGAYNAYQKAIELDDKGKMSKSVDLQYTMLNNDFINLGVEKFQEKDFAGAVEAFEYSLEIGKAEFFGGLVDTTIVYNTGLAAYNGEMYDKAILYFNQAKEMGYGGTTVYQLIERIYLNQGDSIAAEKVMLEGIEAFPDDDAMMIDMINYLLTSNQDDKAFEYLKIAKEKDPGNKSYWYVEGILLDKKGQYDEAMVSYRKAVEIDDAYYSAYYNMGVIQFNKGVQEYDEANKIMDNAEFAVAKAKADKTFGEAIPLFESALGCSEDDKQKLDAMMNLKTLYRRLQMMDKYEDMQKQIDALGI